MQKKKQMHEVEVNEEENWHSLDDKGNRHTNTLTIESFSFNKISAGSIKWTQAVMVI